MKIRCHCPDLPRFRADTYAKQSLKNQIGMHLGKDRQVLWETIAVVVWETRDEDFSVISLPRHDSLSSFAKASICP
jgi:hypothetical protein